MNPSHEEDQQLLSRCLSGDRKASEILVQRFSDLVYRSVQHTLMIKYVCFNSQNLEDLHNTVFLHLFDNGCRKLRQYQGRNGCSLASWIRLIAVRTVLNHLKKRGMDAIVWQKKRISLEDLPELKGDKMEPWMVMEKGERKRLLQDGIRSLSPRDRLFMKLHFNHGLSVAEVASAMQLSIQNAYTVKHRAIKRLKAYVVTAT